MRKKNIAEWLSNAMPLERLWNSNGCSCGSLARSLHNSGVWTEKNNAVQDVERSSSLLKTGRPFVQAGHGIRIAKFDRLIRKLHKVMAHGRLAGTYKWSC